MRTTRTVTLSGAPRSRAHPMSCSADSATSAVAHASAISWRETRSHSPSEHSTRTSPRADRRADDVDLHAGGRAEAARELRARGMVRGLLGSDQPHPQHLADSRVVGGELRALPVVDEVARDCRRRARRRPRDRTARVPCSVVPMPRVSASSDAANTAPLAERIAERIAWWVGAARGGGPRGRASSRPPSGSRLRRPHVRPCRRTRRRAGRGPRSRMGRTRRRSPRCPWRTAPGATGAPTRTRGAPRLRGAHPRRGRPSASASFGVGAGHCRSVRHRATCSSVLSHAVRAGVGPRPGRRAHGVATPEALCRYAAPSGPRSSR